VATKRGDLLVLFLGQCSGRERVEEAVLNRKREEEENQDHEFT
jgi:hypothetical protein